MTTQNLRDHLSCICDNHEFFQWFDSLSIYVDHGAGTILVRLPHRFFADWFEKEKRHWFEQELQTLYGTMKIGYTLPDGHPLAPHDGSLSLDNSKTSFRSVGSEQVHVNTKALTKGIPKCLSFTPGVDFATFLVNKKNDFPLVAAQKTMMDPSCPAYTPFVLHGHAGSGKTHLLNAMANILWEHTPKIPFFFGKVEALLCQDSSQDYIAATKAFFLDDFHQVVESKLLQKEFVSFFDTVQREGLLLALGLDAHPSTLSGLDQKVKQRLKSGLLIELKKPDLDIRLKYILRHMGELELNMGKEEALQLAQRYPDFRAINGALNLIKAHQSLHKAKDSDINFIVNGGGEHTILTPTLIIAHVADYFSVTPEDITGKNRQKNITMARQVAIFFCRELLGLSLAQVGHFFGHRDHSSIVYTLNKIQLLQQSNKVMNNHILQLKKMLLVSP